MPRVAGVNLLAALAAGIAMYLIGFLIYGVVFQELWSQQLLENHGIVAPGEGASLTGDELTEALGRIPQSMDVGLAMGLGFVVSLVQAFAIALTLVWMKPTSMGAALMRAGLLAVGFAVTTLAYNVLYYSESVTNFWIDAIHVILAYLAGSAVIYAIDGKAVSGAAGMTAAPAE